MPLGTLVASGKNSSLCIRKRKSGYPTTLQDSRFMPEEISVVRSKYAERKCEREILIHSKVDFHVEKAGTKCSPSAQTQGILFLRIILG